MKIKTNSYSSTPTTHRLITIFFLFVALLRCSAPQRPLPLRPTPYTVDVVSTIPIDYDAYNVPLPAVSDGGGLRITIGADGGTENGEAITPLRRNQQAPFAGVLFNGPALAMIEVEFRAQEARCLIDRRAELDRLSARAITDLRLLQTTLNTQTASYSLMLQSRDEEIDRLYRYIQANNNPPFPWTTVVLTGLGALLVGATVGTIVTATASR